eukprot:snap_masked-scaffold_7-processed-gene-19.53-mRNA-1 protein AED:1.00 eAED:1.00 QI:0/0/0/0/1/1/2/0/90
MLLFLGSAFEGGNYTVSDDENNENITQGKDGNEPGVLNAEVNKDNIVTSSRVRKPPARLLFRLKVKNPVYFYKITIARRLLPPKNIFSNS